MMSCWTSYPRHRPAFTSLVMELFNILNSDLTYLKLMSLLCELPNMVGLYIPFEHCCMHVHHSNGMSGLYYYTEKFFEFKRDIWGL